MLLLFTWYKLYFEKKQNKTTTQLVNQQTLVSIESKNFLYPILKETNYNFLWYKCTNLDFFVGFGIKKLSKLIKSSNIKS